MSTVFCRLEDLQDGPYEVAFNNHEIPDYVLELVPEEYRPTISGAVYELVDGELGRVWLTDSFAPYHLGATYCTPWFWADDEGDAEVA